MNELCELKKVYNLQEAEIIQSLLEYNNIKTFIFTDNAFGQLPQFNATEGIIIKVKCEDLRDALSLIEENNDKMG